MRELQNHIEHLQRENNCLLAQVEKRHDLGKKDLQDSIQARHPTARNKEKEPIVLDNINTLVDDELSSGSFPYLSPAKSRRVRSGQRRLHRPAFSNVDSGTFHRVRREIGRGQNKPNGVLGNASALPTKCRP